MGARTAGGGTRPRPEEPVVGGLGEPTSLHPPVWGPWATAGLGLAVAILFISVQTAVVVAAPTFEEVFFRGFLLEGGRRWRLVGLGGAVLTALLWAGIYLQPGRFEIGAIFALGVLLAVLRIRSGSLLPCLAAHALVNLVATLETAVGS